MAYLLNKIGNKEDAIKVLIEECENVADILEYAV